MKTVLITGGNRGIGFEVARQLGSMGYMVVLTSRSLQKAQEASEKLNSMGATSRAFELEVSDPESIGKLERELKSKDIVLDVLINNAAVYQDGRHSLSDIPFDLFEGTIKTNLYGPLLMVRSLLPLLHRSSDPRIINLSSGMGATNSLGAGYGGYRISKAALNAMTAILAAELPSMKINSVCPGWVRTDMGGKSAPRSVEQGAETVVWLATAQEIPTGKFLRDKRIISW